MKSKKKAYEEQQQGDFNKHLYRIKEGQVRVEKRRPGLTSLVLTTLTKNQVFGEMSFIEDDWMGDEEKLGNVSADVVVESPTCELYKIDRVFVWSLFKVCFVYFVFVFFSLVPFN
jgi:CRP-like cAMP-binding protein